MEKQVISRESTKVRYRVSATDMGQPCVNCHQMMGTHEPAHRVIGFVGQSHEVCIRQKGMPFLVRQMTMLIEKAERGAFTIRRAPLGLIGPFRQATVGGKLRELTPERFAALLTITLVKLHGLCNNGLGGLRYEIRQMAVLASSRLFVHVGCGDSVTDVSVQDKLAVSKMMSKVER